ncbi:DUF4376 domain-containing protein [Castellaniella caeni]|uniref:DUF4376 domain-containing protein n=1 Tax=Castellaniella caeni TaxID=266123 RepID=UPI000C9F9B4E|nr:DUF4376 domain-containing protein [Castellaniella caeni]
MEHITVWQVDDAGALMYVCPGVRSVGWLQVKQQPPEAAQGHIQVWSSQFNPKTDPQWADQGAWVLKEDHRKDVLWIKRGEKYILGADHEGAAYDGLGPLPAWLHDEEPPAPPLTMDQLRDAKQASATTKRWDVMVGGVTLPTGVRVGTTVDDQNRITSVVANAALAGLADTDVVDFKSESGWIRISIGDVKQIGGLIGQFVQACYTAERAHYDAITAITDYAELQNYDVSVGWPVDGSSEGAA